MELVIPAIILKYRERGQFRILPLFSGILLDLKLKKYINVKNEACAEVSRIQKQLNIMEKNCKQHLDSREVER